MLWPSIHAAVDVFQRRRTSQADHYELIWRLIHICECTTITLASAAISRIRDLGPLQDFLKLRERCYGITWKSTEGSFEKGLGALDGSIDKWIEILQLVSMVSIDGSPFLTALKAFLVGPSSDDTGDREKYLIDLAPFARAWGRACDVPPSVTPGKVSARETFQAINSFRNRFAHVPFPYDQLQDICRELETCTFRLFEIPPTATNEESPLSGYLANREAILRGPGYCKIPESQTDLKNESFEWGKQAALEVWDARPFIFLDKMLRPYLLSRLKNDAGSWEYIRYLAEANAVYSVLEPELFKSLPRPTEVEYPHATEEEQPVKDAFHKVDVLVTTEEYEIHSREEAFTVMKSRNFAPAIKFFEIETEVRPNYHSAWQRLGYAQREWAVDLMETDREKAETLLRESIKSFTRATGHSEPEFSAEAFYNRSKSHWRLSRLEMDRNEFATAVRDAEEAARRYYDHRFISWNEFLRENAPFETKS